MAVGFPFANDQMNPIGQDLALLGVRLGNLEKKVSKYQLSDERDEKLSRLIGKLSLFKKDLQEHHTRIFERLAPIEYSSSLTIEAWFPGLKNHFITLNTGIQHRL